MILKLANNKIKIITTTQPVYNSRKNISTMHIRFDLARHEARLFQAFNIRSRRCRGSRGMQELLTLARGRFFIPATPPPTILAPFLVHAHQSLSLMTPPTASTASILPVAAPTGLPHLHRISHRLSIVVHLCSAHVASHCHHCVHKKEQL